MSFGEVVFFLIIIITMFGGLTAVLAKSIIRALMGLIVAMFGISGLYVYLNSPFLAMMQVLIYVGAVSVLIAFAIMLIGPQYRKPREGTTLAAFAAAAAVSLVSLVMFLKFIIKIVPPGNAPAFAITTREIGRLFFNDLMLPFELISLLIVIAILGAIMLALLSRESQ